MSKLLLLSIVVFTIVLPVRMARMKNPRQGFRKLITWMLVFEAFYLFSLLFLYGRF